MKIYPDQLFITLGDKISKIEFKMSLKDEKEYYCPLIWKSKVAKRVTESMNFGEGDQNAIYLRNILMKIIQWNELRISVKLIIKLSKEQ